MYEVFTTCARKQEVEKKGKNGFFLQNVKKRIMIFRQIMRKRVQHMALGGGFICRNRMLVAAASRAIQFNAKPYRFSHVDKKTGIVKQLRRNRIRCLDCNQIVESTHVHDRQSCRCPNGATADGGLEYMRRLATNLKRIEELAEWDDVIAKK
jgi:hypothetical protein